MKYEKDDYNENVSGCSSSAMCGFEFPENHFLNNMSLPRTITQDEPRSALANVLNYLNQHNDMGTLDS